MKIVPLPSMRNNLYKCVFHGEELPQGKIEIKLPERPKKNDDIRIEMDDGWKWFQTTHDGNLNINKDNDISYHYNIKR